MYSFMNVCAFAFDENVAMIPRLCKLTVGAPTLRIDFLTSSPDLTNGFFCDSFHDEVF